MSSRATQIKTYSWDNAQVILVGNKCDLEDERVIATEDGQRLAEELGNYRSSTLLFISRALCYSRRIRVVKMFKVGLDVLRRRLTTEDW